MRISILFFLVLGLNTKMFSQNFNIQESIESLNKTESPINLTENNVHIILNLIIIIVYLGKYPHK